jgi:hypothetical protein
MYRSRSLAWLLAALGSAGCFVSRSTPEAANPADSVSTNSPDLRNAEVTILIRNRHWLDVNIYLIRGRVSERLATAAGLSEKVISLPWRRVEGASIIRLGADPIGQNRGIITETIQVRPSSVVDWTIESGLRGFHVSVF